MAANGLRVKCHLMRSSGKVACTGRATASRNHLSTLAFPRAEFDALPADVRCKRCSAAGTSRPKKVRDPNEYFSVSHIPGESFRDYQIRKLKALAEKL